MDDGWPASRAYTLGSIANWLVFLAAVCLLFWNAAAERIPGPAVLLVVVALTASVAGQFYAAYRLVVRQDEYIRSLTAKRMIAAAGLTVTLAVFWGLAVPYLGAPDVPMWATYPLFWGAFGMVSPLIRDTRP